MLIRSLKEKPYRRRIRGACLETFVRVCDTVFVFVGVRNQISKRRLKTLKKKF